MDSIQIKTFRVILENRREVLSERLHNRNAIAIENTADVMDEVQLAEERDLATRILERDFGEHSSREGSLDPHLQWNLRPLSSLR